MMNNACDEPGNCICVQCGVTIAHTRDKPCRDETCPSCGRKMLRENGYHHQLLQQKLASTLANDKDQVT